jgi:hypothetical protein
VDISGDGDAVAPVCGAVAVTFVAERAELGHPLGLALEPSFDIDDRVS